jgi:hypothetical protein
MSLLDLYSKGTATGPSGPSARRQKQVVDASSNLKPDNPGSFGNTYADATLAAIRSGKNALTSRSTIVAQQPTGKYTADIFGQTAAGSNSLVKLSKTNNNFGPGKFNNDIIPYTERQFMIQNASFGQATVAPNVLALATQTAPILTPIASNIGTVAGEPFDDGRYNITVGFGFVLYGTMINGGYA